MTNGVPGTLELNPDMHIPTYTKHEIHQQPGGYVGSPFAGPVYHYGTNAFYRARNIENRQDENHTGLGNQMATPADGRVRRILDMGCGIGQLTIAVKERFPEGEVWGVDVAAPMIRYGHMRAVDLNVDVNFAQRLAEETKFPDKPLRHRYFLSPAPRDHGGGVETNLRRGLTGAAPGRGILPHRFLHRGASACHRLRNFFSMGGSPLEQRGLAVGIRHGRLPRRNAQGRLRTLTKRARRHRADVAT